MLDQDGALSARSHACTRRTREALASGHVWATRTSEVVAVRPECADAPALAHRRRVDLRPRRAPHRPRRRLGDRPGAIQRARRRASTVAAMV
eukprot:4925662-Pleurochrysis_carterae.AAC.4